MIRIILLTEHLDDHIKLLYKGAKRYSYENPGVEIYKMPVLYRYVNGLNEGVKALLRWGTDVVIGRIVTLDDLQVFRDHNIKVIALESCKRFNGVPHIIGNHKKLAELCVNYFIDRGHSNFGFFGSGKLRWIDEFSTHCQRIIKEKAQIERFYAYRFIVRNHPWIESSNDIIEWVKSLPKPIGIICCNDKEAYYLIEVCRQCGVVVPSEVAILGIGNDADLCNLSQPTLSSVSIDTENTGYNLVRDIYKSFQNGATVFKDTIISASHVVSRKSTNIFANSDAHVSTVLKYIHNNYEKKILVDNLTQLVPLSRRLLETRFKEATEDSIYQYIQKLRMTRLAERLIESKKSITNIVLDYEYSDYKNIARQFRQFKGMSPSEYRERYLNDKFD